MSLPTQDEVREALKTVFDPEIGINIIDLGLVYGIEIQEDGLIDVEMTLTTPGCPLGHIIGGQMREALDVIPGVKDVRLNLVWTPSWNPTMMSEDAKLELGLDQY